MPTSNFGRNKGRADGLQEYCRACKAESYRKPTAELKRPPILRVPTENGHRFCRQCGTWQPTDAFYKDGKGFKPFCKPCHNANTRSGYQENLDRERERARQYDHEHQEERRIYKRLWRKLFPEKERARNQRYRAQIKGQKEHFTQEEWRALCAYYGNRCLRCSSTGTLTADHVVPLSQGGSDLIANIQPLCKSCNSWKSTKTIDYRT